MRDTQKIRVYKLEEKHLHKNRKIRRHFLTKEECGDLISLVLYEFKCKINPVLVTFHNDENFAVCRTYTQGAIINLPRGLRNVLTVLHECAHALTHQENSHGPLFVATYFRLLDTYGNIDEESLREIAGEMNVEVESYEKTPTRVITHSNTKVYDLFAK